MSMRDALLAEICEHPEDDAPRLVYADWLDDHGQPDRAEFIRLQCRLARLAPDDLEREEIEQRELDLLGLYGQEWSAGLPAWARREPHRFQRGFVGAAHLTATQFLKSGAALFRAAPIEALVLRAVQGKLGEGAACPVPAFVTST